jgi:fibro-slime domain-containing protein
VPGVNQRFLHDIVLTKQSSGIYSYFSDAFFPLDGRGFGNEGNTNNFHFTFEVETRFTYNGGETFTFSGDDDVFVFINGSMALDLGGTHPIATGTISLDTLGLTVGQSYPLKLFFAERHTNKSNFRIDTTIEFLQNKAYEYIVKGVDPDGDPITYILKSGPKGMTIDSKTGLIQWEVDEAHVGRHRVVVHLDDGKNEPVEQSFVLNIRSPR